MNVITNTGNFTMSTDDAVFFESELLARKVLQAIRDNSSNTADKNGLVSVQNARTYGQTETLHLTVYDNSAYDFTLTTINGAHSFIVYHYLTKATNTLTFIALDKTTLRGSHVTECKADAFDASTFFDNSFYNKFVNAVKYVFVRTN